MRNYYQILGVSEAASLEEIKSAYRKLARQYHPDVAKTPEAEKQFKEINRAYEILSDSLRRADYDQTTIRESAKTASGPTANRELLAALSRIGAYIITATLIAFVWQWLIWWLVFEETTNFTMALVTPAVLAGIFLGGFWGADANFKVESFLGGGALSRVYTFLRTTLMGLSSGYLLGLIGVAADKYFYSDIGWITFAGFALGITIGSALGSDGDTVEKIRTNQGRFNLLYTALRGIEIGLIGSLVGLIIGLLLNRLGVPQVFLFWGALTGFIMGDIAGSVAPPNLAAYASYASAYVTSILVVLIVISSLILGVISGAYFHDPIQKTVTIFGKIIISIFQ